MTLKKYTLKVTSPEYWQEIYDTLCGISSCPYIPNREVFCYNEKLHSPTRGTFVLHSSEVENLKNHPHIDWIELDPISYPELYPKPEPATKRFKRNVKVYRALDGGVQPVSTGATSGEINRTGWNLVRTGIRSNREFWTTDSGESIPPKFSDVSYSLTGKNVDVIIHDSGVFQYHPEFLDSNGQSRVLDIVLDGPYYIDPDYFNNVIPAVKYLKDDGRVGIATTSARDWWQNGSKRSVGFSTIGTVTIPVEYTANASMGTRRDGSGASITSGHGTACASLVAGKTHGLAFEANIWNMPGISDNVGMDIEPNYDLMKLFHLYKPINPKTGRKNPTLVNGSWGYRGGFGSSATNIGYRFKGVTGTFATATIGVSNLQTAWVNGILSSGSIYRNFGSSSRSASTDTAANEMMDVGVIYVAAAGNSNQRLGVGSSDPHRLDYIQDISFGSTDWRPEFSSTNLAIPVGHRDWLNPQGIGWNANDPEFHPVICVGAMDDYVYPTTFVERKASYSNNGPGIDVWAPADETLGAGTNSSSGYTDYQRADDTRFYDTDFNGTSAAAPVCCSVIALYLEANPTATSKQVKSWLSNHGSIVVNSSQYYDQFPDNTTTSYWTGSYNMRDAERRILYNPYANDTDVSISGVNIIGISFSQS